MIAELGHYALVLALGLALVQSSVPIWGARTRDPALMAVGTSTALAQFVFVALSFAALTWCHVASDFSLITVFENSHSAKPLIYKITGVWGNHEGSMLLWVLILAVFGAMVAAFGSNIPAALKATVLAKHDERYMPKEVADALKKQGHWENDYAKKSDAGTRKTP